MFQRHHLMHIMLGLFLASPCLGETYEQFAAQQSNSLSAKVAPYKVEVNTLTANIMQRQATGDIHQLASLLQQPNTIEKHQRYPHLLVFVSFSMPKNSLKQWLAQAKKVNGNLVIRGLIHNSFKDTAKVLTPFLKEQSGGLLLDPTLFKRYGITRVPAVVIQEAARCPANQSCRDSFAVVYGNTDLTYALIQIAHSQTKVAPLAQQYLDKNV